MKYNHSKIAYIHLGYSKAMSKSLQNEFRKGKIQNIGKPIISKNYLKFRKYLFSLEFDDFEKRIKKISYLFSKITNLNFKEDLIYSDESYTNLFVDQNVDFTKNIKKIIRIFKYYKYKIKILIITRNSKSLIPSLYMTMRNDLKEFHNIGFFKFIYLIIKSESDMINNQFNIDYICSQIKNIEYDTDTNFITYETYKNSPEDFLKSIELFFDQKLFFQELKFLNRTSSHTLFSIGYLKNKFKDIKNFNINNFVNFVKILLFIRYFQFLFLKIISYFITKK